MGIYIVYTHDIMCNYPIWFCTNEKHLPRDDCEKQIIGKDSCMSKKLIIAVIALILTAGCVQAATVSSTSSAKFSQGDLVVVDDFDDELVEYASFWGWLKGLFKSGKVKPVYSPGEPLDCGDWYGGCTSTYGVGISF